MPRKTKPAAALVEPEMSCKPRDTTLDVINARAAFVQGDTDYIKGLTRNIDTKLNGVNGRLEKLPLMFEAVQILSRDTKAACEMLRNLGGASNDPSRLLPAAPAAQHGVMPQPERMTLTSNECTQLYSRVYQLERGRDILRDEMNTAHKTLDEKIDRAIRRDEASGKALADRISLLDKKMDGCFKCISNDQETVQSLLGRITELEARVNTRRKAARTNPTLKEQS